MLLTVFLPQSRFLHVPKAGGSWVRTALERSGLSLRALEGSQKHQKREEAPHPELFTFAFVRNPWDWWRSFWAYRVSTNWADNNTLIDRLCHSNDFNKFIDLVLEHLPGHLGVVYESYVGPPDDPIEHIGRCEDQPEALLRALSLAGEHGYDAAAVRAVPRVNVSDYSSLNARYSPAQLRALVDAERSVLERFGYDPPR